jgi:hypothetical protein
MNFVSRVVKTVGSARFANPLGSGSAGSVQAMKGLGAIEPSIAPVVPDCVNAPTDPNTFNDGAEYGWRCPGEDSIVSCTGPIWSLILLPVLMA